MDVADHLRGRDPIAEVVHVGRIVLEREIADAVTERGQRTDDRAARDVPDVAAVLLENASGDPGKADDHVAHRLPRHATDL